MGEYIDFEIAKKYLHEACAGLGSNGGLMLKIKFDQEPKADVVEVGRCGECRFTDGLGAIADGRHWCVLHGSFMYYCSDFEREVEDEQIH